MRYLISEILVKLYLIVIFVLTIPLINITSQNIDYDVIVKHVNQTPSDVRNSTAKLSKYLTAPFKSEIEKFASIYYWVAKNIRYDDVLAKNPREYFELKEIIDEVMRSKSGVCQHYSELFAELSRLADLKAYVIEGYTIEKGKIADVSHAWNLINISGKWSVIDATWANAIIISKSNKGFPQLYFMTKPEESIKTHMPFDPIWQILSNPRTYDEFIGGNPNSKKAKFSYNDSINDYFAQNAFDQQTGTIRRMQNNGTFNKLVKKEFLNKQKNLNISVSNQEILKYNKGIIYYNRGTGFFNQYIKLKNNQFKDKKYRKEEILALIDSASVNLQAAELNFATIQIQDPEIKKQLKTNVINISKSKAMIIKEREYIEKSLK